MKSWAQTYMAGSLLGTVLIVAALVAFVPLVSLNAPNVWPTPNLGFVGGGEKSEVGVGSAVAVAAKQPETGGLSSNSVAGSTAAAAGTAIAAVPASGQEPRTPAGVPAKGTVAISPAAVEVASNPGSQTSEGAGGAVTLPNPPEAGGAPTSTATEAGGGDVRNPGETASTPPIDAGAGVEGPESQPPEERPESVPPPPSGGSTEGGDGTGCPEESGEGEAAPTGDGAAPADPSLSAE